MSRPLILNTGRLPPGLMQQLAALYDLHDLNAMPDAAARAAWLAAHGARVDGMVTSAAVGFDDSTLHALPKLRVISSFGVGLDKLPVAAAKARGVAVGYTPDVLNDCVADLAFALLLDVARQVTTADRFVRRGDWTRGPFGLTRKVSGARLGLVGLGRIGRTIARRASGFDMDIRYHSRRAVADVAWPHEPVLTDLARWADHLVVITAGGPETRHLVNAEVLDALGPDGFIVNVARGSVIDEAALQQRRIAGAGLDVYEREPQVPEAFFSLDNVVLAPHMASGTRETRQAMADRVAENLAAFYATGRLVSAA